MLQRQVRQELPVELEAGTLVNRDRTDPTTRDGLEDRLPVPQRIAGKRDRDCVDDQSELAGCGLGGAKPLRDERIGGICMEGSDRL
jgi:hypothetical protein